MSEEPQWSKKDWEKTIEPITGKPVSCWICKHFHHKTMRTCDAFPIRIPFEMDGESPLHFKPIKFSFVVPDQYKNRGEIITVDDHGIQFEPMSREELIELANRDWSKEES